jgi:hypothetical protein
MIRLNQIISYDNKSNRLYEYVINEKSDFRRLDFARRVMLGFAPQPNLIDTTDAQIDRLVYQLYGLTDEEINIIESQVR